MASKRPKFFKGSFSNDSVGNRKTNREIQIPHDGIGNHLGAEKKKRQIPDQIGNSIDAMPTHLLSSVYRKKNDRTQPARAGRYWVGGVNPVISSANHPAAQEQSEEAKNSQQTKRLKRLFEVEETERYEYTLTSKPEDKLKTAKKVLKSIFDKAKFKTKIKASLVNSDDKPQVIAQIEGAAFKDDLNLAALNFLANKIVNKDPADRIRFSIQAI